MRKPVFSVCYQVRLKPSYLAAETSSSLEIFVLEVQILCIILSRQRTTKMLFRLHWCTGLSAPLLFPWYGSFVFIYNLPVILNILLQYLLEPSHEKTCLCLMEQSKDLDQPAQPHSLISSSVIRCQKKKILVCKTCFLMTWLIYMLWVFIRIALSRRF